MTKAELMANPSLWINNTSVLSGVNIEPIATALANYIAKYQLNYVPKININLVGGAVGKTWPPGMVDDRIKTINIDVGDYLLGIPTYNIRIGVRYLLLTKICYQL